MKSLVGWIIAIIAVLGLSLSYGFWIFGLAILILGIGWIFGED